MVELDDLGTRRGPRRSVVAAHEDALIDKLAGRAADQGEDRRRLPSDDATADGEGRPRGNLPLGRGDLVGRYLVLDPLGAGGMGAVFAAYDPELDRKVAIKVLLPRYGDRSGSEGQRRLAREAQTMAKLDHPNVVGVHDVGEHEGRVFVAMDFIEGATLTDWLREQPRAWREVLDVFLLAARGLSAAHDSGLVHRDFKPENVMIDVRGRVRVMDFGLARANAPGASMDSISIEGSEGGAASDGDFTRGGSVVGTPAYMAPEQHAGLPAGPAADQFSFCVGLWEGLHGRRPFRGTSILELATAVVEGNVEDPPSSSRVPAWLRRILFRGLSVEPGERWPSMEALRHALGRGATVRRRRIALAAAGGVAVAGGTLWTAAAVTREQRETSCRERATVVEQEWNEEVSASLHGALQAAGVGYAESSFDRARARLDRYREQWTSAFETGCVAAEVEGTRTPASWDASQRCLADRRAGMGAVLRVLVETADATRAEYVVPAVAALHPLGPCSDEAWLSRNPGTETGPLEEVRERVWRAEALGSVGEHRDGLRLIEADLSDPRLDAVPTIHMQLLSVAATLEHRNGDFQRAAELHRETFDIALASGAEGNALAAAASLADIVGNRLTRIEAGLVWVGVAQGLTRKLGAEEGLGAGKLWEAIANLEDARGNRAAAIEAIDRSIALRAAGLGDEHPDVGLLTVNRGNLLRELSRFEEAERDILAGTQILERALGADHPRVAGALNNLGALYNKQGRASEAEETLRAAISVHEVALGERHPAVAIDYANLAGSLLGQGRPGPAIDAAEHASSIFRETLGEEHIKLAATLSNLSIMYRAAGRLDDAERAAREALRIQSNALGPRHPDVAGGHGNLGATYHAQGKLADAQREYETCLSILQEAGGESPFIPGTYANLGEVLLQQGHYTDAREAYAHSIEVREKSLGPDHPSLLGALVGTAKVEIELGHPKPALAMAQRAHAIATKHDAPATHRVEAELTLARALRAAQTQPDRARAMALQAHDRLAALPGPNPELQAQVDAFLGQQ